MEGHSRYLSSELWQCIFSRLGDGDLKAVSLVCKDFFIYSNPLKQSLKVVHPNITMLYRHLSRFRRLKAIDLFDFEGDIDRAILLIERSGMSSSLESLDIPIEKMYSGWRQSLRFGRLAPNLKALNFRFKTPFNGNTLNAIANTFPNLEQLTMEAPYPPSPLDLGLESSVASSRLWLLKKIHLSSCDVGDEFVIALSLNCVLLKDVALGSSRYLTETGIGHLLRNRPYLEALSVVAIQPRYSPSINVENSIGHNKALTSLVLCGMRNTDEVLKAIAKAKLKVNSLELISCRELTASGLVVVLSEHLTDLSLVGADFTDEDIKLLVLHGNVSNLTHFKFTRCQLAISTLFLLSTSCPSLVDVRMTAVDLYGQVQLDIVPFSVNHKMTSLHLSLCRGIYDEFLKQVGLLFPNLKVLHLAECFEVTRMGIEAILESCKQITELNLSWYDEAEKLFEANDPELVQLNLEVLTLSGSIIDDEGVAALAKKCPRLLSLDLSHCCYITIEGIKQVVQNIKTLTSLNLMMRCDHLQNYGALLDWMLSTDNLASLNKIFLPNKEFTVEQRDRFLQHGCLLSGMW